MLYHSGLLELEFAFLVGHWSSSETQRWEAHRRISRCSVLHEEFTKLSRLYMTVANDTACVVFVSTFYT